MRCVLTSLLIVLALLTVAFPATAVRFLLKNTDPICFVEEVGENTKAVSGDYFRTSVAGADDISVDITVRPADGSVISSTKLSVGSHAFTVDVHGMFGQYILCVLVSVSGWSVESDDRGIPVEFNTDQTLNVIKESKGPVIHRQKVNGEEVFTFRDFGGQQKDVLRSPEYVQSVEQGLQRIGLLIGECNSDIQYLLGRMERMRRTSESTFTRVWACGLIIVLATVVVTWLQFRFLKSTLRRKKLV